MMSGALKGAVLFAALVAGGLTPAMGADNDMAFTAKIKPLADGKFDLTIKNDSREPIVGFSVTTDGVGHEFDYLIAGSVSRTADVLEPQYDAGTAGIAREVWRNLGGTLMGGENTDFFL